MKMSGVKPTPCISGAKLFKFYVILQVLCDPFADFTEYRSIVRALRYLILTRPDLSYSASFLIFDINQTRSIL
jgi:hypothetical protein